MPVYNNENFLKDSIESILEQSFSDFEFIIINDGSTDNSSSIIEKYKLIDSRIKIIHQKKSNTSTVLNKGIKIASGIYIARMDADDIAMKCRLKKQLDYITKYNLDILGSNVHFINQDGVLLGKETKKPLFDSEIKWSLLFSNPLIHPTILARSQLIKKYPYNENHIYAQDYGLWIKLLPFASFGNLKEKLLSKRLSSKNTKEKQYLEQKRIIKSCRFIACRKILGNSMGKEEFLCFWKFIENKKMNHREFFIGFKVLNYLYRSIHKINIISKENIKNEFFDIIYKRGVSQIKYSIGR
ncbi:MAG: glycosyltransferase [Gammaproteobacteria bacterium]|jgi:glycosyltransferase involved in cell wall biosynthesis|nr:glycosyltransferase [Gammaproteobacteria bacterium]